MTLKEKFMNELDEAIATSWMLRPTLIVFTKRSKLILPEKTVNPHVNLEEKKKYYDEAYDDGLFLKSDSEVQILYWEFETNKAKSDEKVKDGFFAPLYPF